jgi:hypothetical protein
MGANKMSCSVPCSPGDYCPGGRCDLNGCYEHSERCVNCNAVLENPEHDLIETGNDVFPRPGDYTICFSCGQPYVYLQNVSDSEKVIRRPLSKNEFRAMPLIQQRVIKDAWDLRKKIIDHIHLQMKGSGDL